MSSHTPGAVSIQGPHAQESLVNDISSGAEQDTILLDENLPSSLIVAAELVQYDEEAGSNMWEKKVQEEVETRLQNLTVAQVVTKDDNETKRKRRMMCCLFLALVLLIIGLVTGIVTGMNKKNGGRY